MVCSECQARNSPAALRCHNCHCALREDNRDRFASSPLPQNADAEAGLRRLRQASFVAVLVAVCLIIFAQSGDWLGRRFLQEGEGAPPDHAALEASYEHWKKAHAQSVVQLMDCYALDARIIRETGQKQTYNDLAQLAQSVRRLGTYDRVTDATLPLFAYEGKRAIVTSRHRYGHTNSKYTPVLGDRTLIWEQRGRRWLIVEDRFPRSYVPTR